jgi:hypothetical protein
MSRSHNSRGRLFGGILVDGNGKQCGQDVNDPIRVRAKATRGRCRPRHHPTHPPQAMAATTPRAGLVRSAWERRRGRRCAAWKTCGFLRRSSTRDRLMTYDTGLDPTSGLLWSVWRKQIAQGAVQPQTELFEQVQANVLFAHLDTMERGFGNAQLPREVPVCRVPASLSYFAC